MSEPNGAAITIEEPPHEPEGSLEEVPSRRRAWVLTILIGLGTLIVGTSLLLVMWILLTVTLELLAELV